MQKIKFLLNFLRGTVDFKILQCDWPAFQPYLRYKYFTNMGFAQEYSKYYKILWQLFFLQ